MNANNWVDSIVPTSLEVRQIYGFIFNSDGRVLLLEDDGHFNLPGGNLKTVRVLPRLSFAKPKKKFK